MNTAFWVTYPLRNCLKMRKNSNMFAVIFNHSQQTWSFTDDVKSNSSSPFYHSLDSDLKALLWKVQLRIFVYGQFAEFFFQALFKMVVRNPKRKKICEFLVHSQLWNLSWAVGESCNSEDKTYQHTSPLCNSKINHDEGFYTKFALHQICLILSLF